MRLRSRGIALVCLLTSVLSARGGRADDLADEADLQFRLGAERYTAGDYRSALEHFLASNRLVRNQNVVFNIARTYEQLARYPEAFRYYTDARRSETDADARGRIYHAVEQIRPHVAVLDISTQPAGATLYVDRKDLGARGEAPRALGVAPGRYKVIASLPGYYDAEFTVEAAVLGNTIPVTLPLRQILGTLRIEGPSRGARVYLDDTGHETPRCLLPCAIEAPPGRHDVRLELAGHRPAELDVEVAADRVTVVKPVLDPLTGTLVVSTDEPGALLEVDGRSRGFSPAILTLPAGEHRLRIARKGYHPSERTVTIGADRQVRIDETLSQAEEVQAASRVAEAVEDAPSSVTIVPSAELRAFAYPTISEAVRGVRGVYLWNDRAYVSLGMRGLGRLGSYTNRELVLVDGHPANDDWIGSAYTGFDARTDLADIERIEVVRGPGSVLYGTNVFSGVVNLVTRGAGNRPAAEIGVSAVDASVGRGRVRAESNLGKDGSIWASISGARGAGRDFYFPESAAEPATGGHSRGADGFDAGTTEGRATWKWLTVQWFLHSHDKKLPTGEYETLLDDPRTHQVDTRAFVEIRAEPRLSREVQLLSRVHWDHYRFRGDYARQVDSGGVERDAFDGSWAGLEQRVVFTPSDRLRLTLGGEGQVHYQVDAEARDSEGPFLDETGGDGRKFRVGAGYGVVDATLSPAVRASAGVRLDVYSTFGSSLNPRAAVIFRPYEGGNLKVLGGRAFRAPSIYELYYNDGGFSQVASSHLDPESIYSFEVEHSHHFSPTVTGLASVYANYVKDLIVSRGDGTETEPLFYANSASPLLSLGAEVGLRREWRNGIMLEGNYGLQRSTFLASERVSDLFGVKKAPSSRHVENSPEHLASFKGAAPILSKAVTIATRLTLEGTRYDRHESTSDPAQGRSDVAFLWDVVFSGREERLGLGYAVGAYNVTDTHLSLPVSNEFAQTRIQQNGRTFLASADVRF